MRHFCGRLREVGVEFAGGSLSTYRSVSQYGAARYVAMREVAGDFSHTTRARVVECTCACVRTRARAYVYGSAENLPQPPASRAASRLFDGVVAGYGCGRLCVGGAEPPANLPQTSRRPPAFGGASAKGGAERLDGGWRVPGGCPHLRHQAEYHRSGAKLNKRTLSRGIRPPLMPSTQEVGHAEFSAADRGRNAH